jgi:hypothetical protein
MKWLTCLFCLPPFLLVAAKASTAEPSSFILALVVLGTITFAVWGWWKPA